ncbi:hypothetical protein Tco_0267086 [Tanacetum coccineum]
MKKRFERVIQPGVSASLGGEIFSGGKKSWESDIGRDGDTGMGDSTGVSVSLGGKISLGGKKYQELNIGGGKIAGRAIITWGGGIASLISESGGR